MAGNETNQRVTNAILQKDITNLAVRVEQWQKETKVVQQRDSGRLKVVEAHVIKCATLWEGHEKAHQTIDGDIKAVEGDVKKWSLFGGGGGGFLAILFGLFFDR